MTAKDRVWMAVHHEEPDRVPMGEWEYGGEFIDRVLGRHTLFASGLEKTLALWRGERDRVIADWKTSLVDLVRALEWDAVLVHNVIGAASDVVVPEPVADHRWRYENGDVLTYSKETDRLLFTARGENAPAPVQRTDPGTTPDVESTVPTATELEVVRHVVRELGATHFLFSAPLMGHPKLKFSDATVSEVETWVRLYEDPVAFGDDLLKRLADPVLLRGIATARKEGMDGIAFGWDFGCNTGPFMSPALFRQAVLPYLGGYVDLVHRQGMVFLLHSCGNNRALMDMIVEAGVDVYQSIQAEMDIKDLKQRYGRRITLWGGVPAGDLVACTADAVRATARDSLLACKPGGGYVFGTGHSIMPQARYENYLAMLDVLREFGNYGENR